ncbi:hypothetical protein ACHHYP_08943 [Achlya hypogyna]|uniref:Myb-like domain-containing protein n=1 Tax=Achlya hypogyna TaxID=1202772 RepID=A0A1V9ZJV0_ACHHY|nr:hypothetical protein ACHHYP_08943 [Achlya hypogyna]
MTGPPPYTGPRLASRDELPRWKPSFLNAADLHNLRQYYVEPTYEDPNLADIISASQMDAFRASAEASEPAVASYLPRFEREEAMRHRVRSVNALVSSAVKRECGVLNARARHAAAEFLLSAVEPDFHEVLADADGPYEMWAAVEALGSDGCTATDHGRLLDDALALRYIAGESPATFFERFEAVAGRYLAVLLRLPATSAEDKDAVVEYRDAIAGGTLLTLLARACPPEMVALFQRWQEESPRGDFGFIKQRASAHLAALTRGPVPPQSCYCHYCHSKKHSDSMCYHLAKARADGIVRAGYALPLGEAFPTLDADTIQESTRRFCTYCQSTKHRDAGCAKLKADVRSGSTRRGYLFPIEVAARPDKRPVPVATVTPTKNTEKLTTSPPTSDDEFMLQASRKAKRAKAPSYIPPSDASSDGDQATKKMVRRAPVSWTDDELRHLVGLADEMANDWTSVLRVGFERELLHPSRTLNGIRMKFSHYRRALRDSQAGSS